MHEEDVVQSQPKEWETTLAGVLNDLERLHLCLKEHALAMRAAIVQRDHADVLTSIAEFHGLSSELREVHRRGLAAAQAAGILTLDESFTIGRLRGHAKIRSRPRLAAHVERLLAAVRATNRETTLNGRLIERLSAWNEREIKIMTAPLTDAGSYDAGGEISAGTTRPALLDRKG